MLNLKNKNIIVIAPHPDDETLGCGGTIFELKKAGNKIYWLIVTDMSEDKGFHSEKINSRKLEIEEVNEHYNFNKILKLGIPTSNVDTHSKSEIISRISEIFREIKPNIVFIPFIHDVHTDHKIISESVISTTKWFRHSYIESVLYYETISETDFNIDPSCRKFNPNIFIDISQSIEEKIEVMKIYKTEIDEFPFPRSELAIKSLAHLRGSQSGFKAAEAFELLRYNLKIN